MSENLTFENGTSDMSNNTFNYFSTQYRIIGTFFNSIIFVVGVLGNMMVVAVVLRTRSMHSPTNCYLVSLAIADTVALMATVPTEIYRYYLQEGKWVTGETGCILWVFTYSIGIDASSLSLVAFTVERYVAICHPMKAHIICTVRRAKKIILAVWIFTIVYCTPWLFLIGLQEGQCNYKLAREKYLCIFMADLFLFYVVPLLVSCFLYVSIARVLLTRGLSRSNDRLIGTVQLEMRSGSSAKNQVVKMLAVVVAVFATLWLPYRGMLVYNSFAPIFQFQKFLDPWYLMFAKSCIYINCAINPILYNAMSYKFRRAFRKALSCGTYKPRPTTVSINSLKRKRSVNSTSTSTTTTMTASTSQRN